MAERAYYLEQLGIPSWLCGNTALPKKAADKKRVLSRCLVVETADVAYSFLEDHRVKALLFKMLAAIHLSADDVVCIRISDKRELRAHLASAQAVLVMSDAFEKDSIKEKGVFMCPHPSQIIADETLKKSAWQVLQQVEQWLIKTH